MGGSEFGGGGFPVYDSSAERPLGGYRPVDAPTSVIPRIGSLYEEGMCVGSDGLDTIVGNIPAQLAEIARQVENGYLDDAEGERLANQLLDDMGAA